jgi:hypothetical protein
MLNSELILFLFDGKSSALSDALTTWLISSRRFAAFVDSFRDKIRKKIRVIRDPESLLDLQLELETAYLILQKKEFSLNYEPDHAKRIARAPDFAVTYTSSLTFLVEVTRMRGESYETTPPTNINPKLSALHMRLADTICSKLGQLQPKQPNLLLIALNSSPITQNDLRDMMLHIQGRAERNDPAFLKRYGFRDRADFFAHDQRLSEILVRESQTRRLVVWVNPRAKCPLPSRVHTALYGSHAE